jgi:hypothetical protein
LTIPIARSFVNKTGFCRGSMTAKRRYRYPYHRSLWHHPRLFGSLESPWHSRKAVRPESARSRRLCRK